MRKSSLSLLAAVCLLTTLSGCSQANQKDTKTGAADAAPKKPAVTTSTTPSGQKQIKISLDSLPEDMVICTVGGKNISIGDYRRMLKLQQAEAQANISLNPLLRANLLQEATKRKVTLTPEEKAKLIESAKAQHKDFQAFLKEKNMTEAAFDKEIEQAGLIFKMSNAVIEEQLLAQLVSRKLLASATTDPAAAKNADSVYAKLKTQTKDFEQLRKSTGLTADDIKQETITAELARVQVAKLEKTIHVTDKEIRDFYNKNQNLLKHNERIRLSRIVVLAPEQTLGPLLSVKEQVQKANPKLEGKDLDATVAQVLQQQQQKALVLLGEANATGNFATLANQKSDDPAARAFKNGGDMGWQEKQQLVPQFAEAVWGIKPGTVLPKLVKTTEGYSIIKVTAHEKAGTLPLSEVRPIIEAKVKQDKLQKAINTWIADRQKTVKVEFSPKFLQIATGGEAPKTTTN